VPPIVTAEEKQVNAGDSAPSCFSDDIVCSRQPDEGGTASETAVQWGQNPYQPDQFVAEVGKSFGDTKYVATNEIVDEFRYLRVSFTSSFKRK
jgi:hypothetical protein